MLKQRGELDHDAARRAEHGGPCGRGGCGAERDQAIENGREQAETRIRIKHQFDRADLVHALRRKQLRRGGGERAGGSRHRADQAVAREGLRALLSGDALRQRGMLQWNEQADVAARRIDRAEECDDHDDGKRLEGGQRHARCRHQDRAEQQQIAQRIAPREHADRERRRRGAEQRRRRHDADFHRPVAERRQIDRQQDDRKTVAEAAQRACGIEQPDGGRCDHVALPQDMSHLRGGARQHLAASS